MIKDIFFIDLFFSHTVHVRLYVILYTEYEEHVDTREGMIIYSRKTEKKIDN